MPQISVKRETKSELLILISVNSLFHANLDSVHLRVIFNLFSTLLGIVYLTANC